MQGGTRRSTERGSRGKGREALSLPSMIVLFGVMGKKQAASYILLVIILSALAGDAFGAAFPAPPAP